MINFSDVENREKMLNLDKNSLNATLSIQKNLNSQLLAFMKNYVGNVQVDFNSDSKAFYYMNTAVIMLSKSNENIKSIQDLLSTIDELSKNMHSHSFENNIDELFKNMQNPNSCQNNLEEMANEYNNQFNEVINSVYENTSSIEGFIHEISTVDISALLKELSSNTANEKSQNAYQVDNSTISSDVLNSSYIENTLIISDIQGKVILPYTIENVKNILATNGDRYSSISDVIEKIYTKPMQYYRYSAIARFREAYRLMIRKEHSSRFKALCLASELFTNYNLHPAIITACNSLDELDIYLACLEDDTLDEFHYFDIKYEIPPVMVTD